MGIKEEHILKCKAGERKEVGRMSDGKEEKRLGSGPGRGAPYSYLWLWSRTQVNVLPLPTFVRLSNPSRSHGEGPTSSPGNTRLEDVPAHGDIAIKER